MRFKIKLLIASLAVIVVLQLGHPVSAQGYLGIGMSMNELLYKMNEDLWAKAFMLRDPSRFAFAKKEEQRAALEKAIRQSPSIYNLALSGEFEDGTSLYEADIANYVLGIEKTGFKLFMRQENQKSGKAGGVPFLVWITLWDRHPGVTLDAIDNTYIILTSTLRNVLCREGDNWDDKINDGNLWEDLMNEKDSRRIRTKDGTVLFDGCQGTTPDGQYRFRAFSNDGWLSDWPPSFEVMSEADAVLFWDQELE